MLLRKLQFDGRRKKR